MRKSVTIQAEAQAMLTCIQSVEAPGTTVKCRICLFCLLLAHTQVDLKELRWRLLLRDNQASAIAIALVLTIDVDEHGNAWGDVAVGREMNCEIDLFLWHGNDCSNIAITVYSAVFFKFDVGIPKLD